MRSRVIALCALTAALTAVPVRDAHADWLLTPYLGVTFGGSAPTQQVTYGLSSAFLGGGMLGLELDAALTPNFFDSDTNALEDSNVSTVMANLMVAAPGSGAAIRPYVAAGAGILRRKATSVGNVFDLDDKSFGVNVGGGILAQMNDKVGVRGDIRYFRALQDADGGENFDLDLDGFNFWRGTLGVTFRF
ncbi:MAG: outer membrane protein [Vicinamibacterales bacterium]